MRSREPWTDADGQPAPSFRAAHNFERDITELLGIARGILFDGVVSPKEAEMLAVWCNNHPEVVSEWPGSVVADRLRRVFADGVVDAEEQADLRDLLEGLVGGTLALTTGFSGASALPLCKPAPELVFQARTYLMTGKFAFGPRKACQAQVTQRGGAVKTGISKQVDVLVIGSLGSRDWIQTSYGRKIQGAVDLRDSGHPVSIVSEDHWAAALD